MYFVYVLQSLKDKLFYTGFTADLENRIRQYNNKEELSTQSRTPFRLIYSEACLDRRDALVREKYLKSGVGKKYLTKRLEAFFDKNTG